MRRIILLMTVTLVVLCAMPCPSDAAPTSNQILSYQHKMFNNSKDLIDIGKNITGLDQEITINLIVIVTESCIELKQIQDFILIESLVKHPDDMKRIKPIIRRNISFFGDQIDLDIKQINLGLSHLNNQAVISTATKLRDDLRELQELLRNSE